MNRVASARATLASVAAGVLLLTGCGGGSPLLHPARTLPSGDVRAAAGVSANITPGSLGNAVDVARDAAARDPQVPGAPGTNPAYAKGALVAAAVAPGLAPFVAARVGIGSKFEGGLAYTGRGARVDMRHGWDVGSVSYSAGLGLSVALYGRQQGSELPNVDLGSLHGYGADIPLLVGWESAGGIYKLWGGARGGFEHVVVEKLTSEPSSVSLGGEPLHLDANRFWGGAVVGLGTGFRHVHVAIELSAAYQSVIGNYNENRVTVQGFTLAPATALWFTF
ncbi:MAG: hypothetical protein JWP97_3598 [Labilithrix sp.]|nr:hypothetical protein [Labilithrix sp.]